MTSGKQPKVTRKPAHKSVANSSYAQAIADIRKSNAAGPHLDKRTKRARTRAALLRKSLKEAETHD